MSRMNTMMNRATGHFEGLVLVDSVARVVTVTIGLRGFHCPAYFHPRLRKNCAASRRISRCLGALDPSPGRPFLVPDRPAALLTPKRRLFRCTPPIWGYFMS